MGMSTANNFSKSSVINAINTYIGLDEKDYVPQWSQVFKTLPTATTKKEEFLMRSGMHTAYESSEGGATPLDNINDEWVQTILVKVYKLGFSITQEAIDDQQLGKLLPMLSTALGRAFRHTKEIRAAAHFNNATSTSRPYKGGDGVALLSTAHPLANGDTFSNFLSGVQLSESALETADILIRKMVDERGLRIMVKPKQLIIPPDLTFAAARLLQSDLRPGTNNNDINAIKRSGRLARDPVELTYLTDADSWFIQTDVDNGLAYLPRIAYKTDMEKDGNTGVNFAFGYERYGFGHINPRCIVGSMGA